MAGKQVPSDFQTAINDAREKKKNEALAAKIFGPGRVGTPQKAQQTAGGSIASRAGVKKRGVTNTPPSGPRAQAKPNQSNNNNSRFSSPNPSNNIGSLASRITDPSKPAGPAARVKGNQRRAAQVAQALIRTELHPPRRSNALTRPAPVNNAINSNNNNNSAFNRGITIRGLAGPFVIMAQNFAPGTTAADIESAMTPVGGLISSCRLLKTTPIVIAEIVFESKEGADAVIARFNNQTADGRLLHVYHKLGGGSAAPAPAPAPASAPFSAVPKAPRAVWDRDDMVVDGSMGFDEPDFVIDTQGSGNRNGAGWNDRDSAGAGVGGRGGGGNGGGGLYSDRMVPERRSGRGFGGRSGRGGGR